MADEGSLNTKLVCAYRLICDVQHMHTPASKPASVPYVRYHVGIMG